MNTPTTDIYIPPGAEQMSTIKFPQIRLALQSAGGCGKTTSGLTFPNPVVADIDDNLTAHTHRTDVYRLPFTDPTWVKKNFPEIKCKYPIRDAVPAWIAKEGSKLTENQTFFLDSWTTLQDAFDLQTNEEPAYTKSGNIDEFAKWDRKIDYSRELLTSLKTLRCHVVVSFHEQDNRDAAGVLTGKVEPLMQGKFQKKLSLYFTDWFRCVAQSKLDPNDKKKVIGCDYFWQTKSSSEVNLKSRLDLPMLIEPNFKSLSAYFTQAN